MKRLNLFGIQKDVKMTKGGCEMKKMMKSNKGFSLVELLIALLIMAVIAAIAIGLFGGVLNTSKTSADRETAETIKKALLTYMNGSNDIYGVCIVDPTATTGGGLVATLGKKITIQKNGSGHFEYTYDGSGGGTTSTSDSSIQEGTYGPLLDKTKVLLPQHPDYKSWKVIIHAQSLTCDVSATTDASVLVNIQND